MFGNVEVCLFGNVEAREGMGEKNGCDVKNVMITLYPRWFAVKRQLPRGGRYDLKR